MSHWINNYLTAKWEEETDCLYWFRKISKDVFGRDVPECKIDFSRHLLSTTRVMRGNIVEMFGYKERTDAPIEGDAVFMSQCKSEHHLGMVIFSGNTMMIAHVLNGVGMVISDENDLLINGWKIKSYWTPCD